MEIRAEIEKMGSFYRNITVISLYNNDCVILPKYIMYFTYSANCDF